MKKSKLSVGLVASFIGALAMTACNDTSRIKERNGDLVEFVSYNGSDKKIVIGANDLYGKYSKSKEGTQLYYNAILEALVRYEYKSLADASEGTLTSYEVLYGKAESSVKKAKETATENAKNNDTKYDDEWASILESHDCETEEDLLQHYLYDLEKEELIDKYFKNNESDLMDEFLGLTNEWKPVDSEKKTKNVNSTFPYHVLHVLVKLDDASYSKTEYNKSTISKGEAQKLWNVVERLIEGDTKFQDVAGDKNLNDDNSWSKYGDVGVITPKTTFVNEFKLGLYAYDALLSGVNTETDDTRDIYKAFGIDSSAEVEVLRTVAGGVQKEKVTSLIQSEMSTNVKTPLGAFNGVPTIPYDVFRKLGKFADEEKIDNEAPESGDVALPRNILFNQFLNFHSPFVITDDDLVVDTNKWGDDAITVAAHDFVNDSGADKYIVVKNNFRSGIVEGKKVLCDKEGNVIIGVLSEYGIHFMIMRKSVFKNTNLSVVIDDSDPENVVTKADTSLQDYYTTLIPGEDGYPTGKQTYVDMVVSSDKTSYKERADEIKSDVKDTSVFDVAYEYRLYEYLYKQVKDKIVYAEGKDYIESNIKSYIELLRENRVNSDADSINSAWETYLLALTEQNFQRGLENTRVSATCAFTFNSDNANEYKKAKTVDVYAVALEYQEDVKYYYFNGTTYVIDTAVVDAASFETEKAAHPLFTHSEITTGGHCYVK